MQIAPVAQRIERIGSNDRVGGSNPSRSAAQVAKIFHMVAVAQLVRASGCGPECRGFKSPQPPILTKAGNMSAINFETKLFKIGTWTILRLPEHASAKLPSRGMIMVKGEINDIPFKTLLEPDGRYGTGIKPSHWFAPDKKLLDQAHASVGDIISVSLEPTKEWIEPEVPEDLRKALSTSPKAEFLWKDITPLARWDWIRWIRAVKTSQTRQKHIEVALDKLNRGMRRPCCFNRNMCSEPQVSHNWALRLP